MTELLLQPLRMGEEHVCQGRKLRTSEIILTPREGDASISLGFPLIAPHYFMLNTSSLLWSPMRMESSRSSSPVCPPSLFSLHEPPPPRDWVLFFSPALFPSHFQFKQKLPCPSLHLVVGPTVHPDSTLFLLLSKHNYSVLSLPGSFLKAGTMRHCWVMAELVDITTTVRLNCASSRENNVRHVGEAPYMSVKWVSGGRQ